MKINVYFLFYVAMILELLVFIVDRDEAEQQIVKVHNLVTMYSQPLKILPPQQTEVVITTFARDGRRYERAQPETVNILIPVINLFSESERKAIKYKVIDLQTNSELSYSIDAAGNCIFRKVFSAEGQFRFSISASVVRILPDYLPKRIRTELQKELAKMFGDSLVVPSNSLIFVISAKEQMNPLPPCPC
jgi:hypothetical protein